MALACTLGVCAALALPAGAAYADVAPGSWYEAAVNQVTEQGYMEGVSDTQFAPDAYALRLVRAGGGLGQGERHRQRRHPGGLQAGAVCHPAGAGRLPHPL